jgi:hypothetical protein
MEAITGRTARRIPRPLQGVTTEGLIAAFGGDRWVNPDSGGLVGQRAIEAALAELPKAHRLSRRQLYNTLYDADGPCARWVRRVGDVVATNVSSLNHWATALHPQETLVAHLNALGVNVGRGQNTTARE